MTINGGRMVVHGPTRNDNAPIDYDGSFTMTGGYIAAAGSSGMAQQPGASSSINAVLITFSTTRSGGSPTHIQSESGTSLVNFTPSKSFQAFILASPALTRGSSNTVLSAGTVAGTVTNGLAENGTYSGGSRLGTFQVSSVSTRAQF